MKGPYLYIKIRKPTETEEPDINKNYLLIEYIDKFNEKHSNWLTPPPNKDNPWSFSDKLYDWSTIEGPWLYEEVYGTGIVNEKTAEKLLVLFNKKEYDKVNKELSYLDSLLKNINKNDTVVVEALKENIDEYNCFKKKMIKWFVDLRGYK